MPTCDLRKLARQPIGIVMPKPPNRENDSAGSQISMWKIAGRRIADRHMAARLRVRVRLCACARACTPTPRGRRAGDCHGHLP